jgi:hypothetical protein
MKRLVLFFVAGLVTVLSAQIEVVDKRNLASDRDTLIAPTANKWHTSTFTGDGWDTFIVFSSNNADASFNVAFEDTTNKITVPAGCSFRIANRPATKIMIQSNGSATATFVVNKWRRMPF